MEISLKVNEISRISANLLVHQEISLFYRWERSVRREASRSDSVRVSDVRFIGEEAPSRGRLSADGLNLSAPPSSAMIPFIDFEILPGAAVNTLPT